MNKYLMTLPEETRDTMLSLLRKMLACFEMAGGDKAVGLPSEVSTAVVAWLKQLLEDVFDEVPPPPPDRRCSSFSTTSDEEEEEDLEEEEESEARRERECVPFPFSLLPSPPPPQVIFFNLSVVSVDNPVPRLLFITQPMPRVCQTAFIKKTTTASVSHAMAKKSRQASAERKRRSKETRSRPPLSPSEGGSAKRTRSAVGQEWDLLIALKRHRAGEKSQQQQQKKSRRWDGEFDQTKASLTCIHRGKRGSVDSRDDEEADFEKQEILLCQVALL